MMITILRNEAFTERILSLCVSINSMLKFKVLVLQCQGQIQVVNDEGLEEMHKYHDFIQFVGVKRVSIASPSQMVDTWI